MDSLFDDILITVTEFFRDPATFEALVEKAFPAILNHRSPEETIRVWVTGCASGKEVYSLAICLIEYLERTEQRVSDTNFRHGCERTIDRRGAHR